MKLVDSHCHLNYDYSPKTAADIIREAHEAGVVALITIGTDLLSIAAVEKISESDATVFHTVGVHPHDAVHLSEADLPTLECAASHPKCRAIGEIGLDYYYENSPQKIQQERLELQLDLALRLKKPVVIHSREGEADLLFYLKKYCKALSADQIPGIIHCFSGTEKFGKECVDLGFYLSFSGILTFKKAEEVRATAQNLPLERFLVETDSPYLAPVPFRGKKCEPSMVVHTARKLAELRGTTLEEVARITTANAQKIFKLP